MTGRFRRRLAELKRNGCNVLLVGTGPLDAACERLLGESSAGPRYRLLVTTDARPPTARAKLARVQSGPYADSAAVVDWNVDLRGTVADGGADATRLSSAGGPEEPADESIRGDDPARSKDGPTRQRGGPTRREEDTDSSVRTVPVESDDLDELAGGVEEAIASFERRHGEFSPAELRVCFDSLTPLVADDQRDVQRLLADLTDAVEQADGMGHYHLPAEYRSEAVATVEPEFDAAVEVRRAAGRAEQRWHLTDPDLTTRWLPL